MMYHSMLPFPTYLPSISSLFILSEMLSQVKAMFYSMKMD